MSVENLAAEAASLRDNEAFQASLSGIKARALEVLSTIDADDTLGILKQQAIVKVVDDLNGDLEGFIARGKPKRPPGIA